MVKDLTLNIDGEGVNGLVTLLGQESYIFAVKKIIYLKKSSI